MNRGTALKWIKELEDCEYFYDFSQLSLVAEEGTYMSPTGVLCNFFDKSTEVAWDGVSVLWDKNQFDIPEDYYKKSKMKNSIYDPINFGSEYGKISLVDLEQKCDTYRDFAKILSENYEKI